MELMHRYSARSLFITLWANGQPLSQATGFIMMHNGHPYLITNYHVLAGRHPKTGQPLDPNAAIPDTVNIYHHNTEGLGHWFGVGEPLYDAQSKPLFFLHPANQPGSIVDIAALPLTDLPPEVVLYPVEFEAAPPDMIILPSMAVSIVGFPAGIRAGGYFPVWKTGHIASEPIFNYGEQPSFLIDATTRSGMSGSPVYLIALGGYPHREGGTMIASAEVFLGIYSSRLTPQLENIEIGLVWKPEAINAILVSRQA